MKPISKEEYARRVETASPPSPVLKNCLFAFLSGGAVCTLGEVLCEFFQSRGLEILDARAAVSICLISLSALLTALGRYDRIAKHTGAGTLVPITGFANSMAAPALEFKDEGLVGLGAKLFTISGPVIVYGIAAGMIYGLLLWLKGLLFH